jgi:hypothetical protein
MDGMSSLSPSVAVTMGAYSMSSLPVWLWPQFITTFMVLGATLSNNYSTFTAFRSLQGLFGTIPQVVGLPIIHDMYEPKGMQIHPTQFDNRSS